MSYTPVELRHVPVGRRLFGYDRKTVEQILKDVADSFETVWRDRGELADRVEALEQELEESKRREQLLTNTLVAAEQAAEEMRDRAKREAELIVSEAHAEARSVLHAGQGERERLLAEVRRIEWLLRSALGIVGEAGALGDAPVASAAPAQEAREPRPIAGVPEDAQPEPEPEPQAQPAPATSSPEPAGESAPGEDDAPGWPPLRKVAQGGGDFDWGD
jgi:cell division initiation protein